MDVIFRKLKTCQVRGSHFSCHMHRNEVISVRPCDSMKKEKQKHSQSKNTFIYITWITSADKNHSWPTLAVSHSADQGSI